MPPGYDRVGLPYTPARRACALVRPDSYPCGPRSDGTSAGFSGGYGGGLISRLLRAALTDQPVRTQIPNSKYDPPAVSNCPTGAASLGITRRDVRWLPLYLWKRLTIRSVSSYNLQTFRRLVYRDGLRNVPKSRTPLTLRRLV
jgi:hypothetical protein